jgi:hypothetical protein
MGAMLVVAYWLLIIVLGFVLAVILAVAVNEVLHKTK